MSSVQYKIILLYIACMFAVVIDGEYLCPDESWYNYEGSANCYKLFKERKSWDEANDYCLSLGTHLLTIDSNDESVFIQQYISTEEGLDKYDTEESSWYHVGLRRVESHRYSVQTTGVQGFTWVDGTILDSTLSSNVYWRSSKIAKKRFVNPMASALQIRVHQTALEIGFAYNVKDSLNIKQKFICKANAKFRCGEDNSADAAFTMRDSRMTPVLCAAVCLTEGYSGYATVYKDSCSCFNAAMPAYSTYHPCSTKCKVEPWLSCGGSDGRSLHIKLPYYSKNSLNKVLSCDNLYSNGVVRPMAIDGEYCSVKMEKNSPISRDLYCPSPEFFPLRSLCLYVSNETNIPTYYHSQFSICGQMAFSDLFVFNKPRHNSSVAHLYKQSVDVYEHSMEADLIMLTFMENVVPRVPYLKKPGAKFVVGGAITHKMSNHPRTTHGSLSPFWPVAAEDGELKRPLGLVQMLPNNPKFNPTVERLGAISISNSTIFLDGTFGKESFVTCATTPGYTGCRNIEDIRGKLLAVGLDFLFVRDDARLLNIFGCIELCRAAMSSQLALLTNSQCLCSPQIEVPVVTEDTKLCFSPCPDPSSIQQCPSVPHLARTFKIGSYHRLASSCRELWRNGAYYYGPYHIKSPANGSQSITVYCNDVPHDGFIYRPITGWTYEGSGGAPPSWTEQLRPHLFSDNVLSLEGVGYLFPPQDRSVTIILRQFYLIRGIKTLGRGDYDIATVDAFNFPRGFVTELNISYYSLENRWMDADQNVRANIEDEEDLAVIAFNRPIITSQLKLIVNKFARRPILRVELLGSSLATKQEVEKFNTSQKEASHSLGCYRKDDGTRSMAAGTEVFSEALRTCYDWGYPYLVKYKHEINESNEMVATSQLTCYSGGRVQTDKVADTYCDDPLLYLEYFDTFDLSSHTCAVLPTPPDEYIWTGMTLINQHVQLECKFPSVPAVGTVYAQYKCFDSLLWDKRVYNPDLPQCLVLPCTMDYPVVENASPKGRDSLVVGDTIEYQCVTNKEWEDQPQKAACNHSGDWELITPIEKCVPVQCPRYVDGFKNSTDNLHPVYKETQPKLYAEFMLLKWRLGSEKLLECPDGTLLSNAMRTTYAKCSADTQDWTFPDGRCIEGVAPDAKFLALTAEDAGTASVSWKKFVPAIVVIGTIALLIIGAYAAFTMYNERKGAQFKSDLKGSPPSSHRQIHSKSSTKSSRLFRMHRINKSGGQVRRDNSLHTAYLTTKKSSMFEETRSQPGHLGISTQSNEPLQTHDVRHGQSTHTTYLSTKDSIRTSYSMDDFADQVVLPNAAPTNKRSSRVHFDNEVQIMTINNSLMESPGNKLVHTAAEVSGDEVSMQMHHDNIDEQKVSEPKQSISFSDVELPHEKSREPVTLSMSEKPTDEGRIDLGLIKSSLQNDGEAMGPHTRADSNTSYRKQSSSVLGHRSKRMSSDAAEINASKESNKGLRATNTLDSDSRESVTDSLDFGGFNASTRLMWDSLADIYQDDLASKRRFAEMLKSQQTQKQMDDLTTPSMEDVSSPIIRKSSAPDIEDTIRLEPEVVQTADSDVLTTSSLKTDSFADERQGQVLDQHPITDDENIPEEAQYSLQDKVLQEDGLHQMTPSNDVDDELTEVISDVTGNEDTTMSRTYPHYNEEEVKPTYFDDKLLPTHFTQISVPRMTVEEPEEPDSLLENNEPIENSLVMESQETPSKLVKPGITSGASQSINKGKTTNKRQPKDKAKLDKLSAMKFALSQSPTYGKQAKKPAETVVPETPEEPPTESGWSDFKD